jgi:O-antigen ligase
LGLLLALLPLLALTRRLFPENALFFPSIETIAVVFVWGCVQVRSLKHGAPRDNSSWPINVALFVFLMTGLISSVLSRDPDLSLRILVAGGLAPILCYSLASRYLKTDEDVQYVVYGMLALAIQTTLFTAIYYDRRQATLPSQQELYAWLYSEAPVANLFVVPSATVSASVPAILLAVWYLLYGKWQKMLVGGSVILGAIYVAALSLSRGSWLGAVVALIGSLPLVFKHIRINVVILAISILALGYVSGAVDSVLDMVEFRTNTRSTGSVDARQANYVLALQSASQHMLIGVGLGQYPDIYAEFPSASASRFPPLWFAHSLFLTLIPEIGLLGAVAFAYVVMRQIVRGIRLRKDDIEKGNGLLGYALSMGIIAYLVIASTSGTHLVAYLMYGKADTYFMAPAMIVVFTMLGALAALQRDQAPVRLISSYSSQTMPAGVEFRQR